MTGCPAFPAGGPDGIAEALRSVDCMSARATAAAFARLFGVDGRLGTALTAVLTLFIGWIAVGLLTGRLRIGLAGLTPRAMLLGVTLCFATSWAVYQAVVWNVAAGAPDQIAGLLLGTHGSATILFADRLDQLFAAVADAATAAQAAAASDGTAMVTPADLLWLGALLLLLGTVGVLLVARIALAALLALGPIFILLALFRGTRGLFEGWLRGTVLFALIPLFAVLIGGGALAMLAPIVSGLGTGELTMRAAVTVLLGACVYCALMLIVFRVAASVAGGWRLPGDRAEPSAPSIVGGSSSIAGPATGSLVHLTPATVEAQGRVRAIVAGLSPVNDAPAAIAVERRLTMLPPNPTTTLPSASAQIADDRAWGLAGRFRTPTPPVSREMLS
jgi:type IV secretion system protein VirB6